jgi:hypothetical protein
MDSDKPEPEGTLEESAKLLRIVTEKYPGRFQGQISQTLASLNARVGRIARPTPITNCLGNSEKN